MIPLIKPGQVSDVDQLKYGVGKYEYEKANAIIDSLNAKEQGVQPTPSSSNTQGTYLNPSYGNVTQAPYTAPLQKSQNAGTVATAPVTPKVDPVRAMLDKTGKKPTLDQAQITQSKTLQENLQGAAYQAEAKQQYQNQPATMPKSIEEQKIDKVKEAERKLLMAQTQGTGKRAANIADPEALYPAGKPLDPAIVQQGIKDNTLHLDEAGGLHRANNGKWEPYPIAHSQKDGSFQPVALNSWTNAGGMAMHGTSSMYIPPTGVAPNSFNRPTSKAETFATGLLGTGARYFTGKSPDYPLGQQTIGQQGEMVGDLATSLFAGSSLGGYFREASPVLRGIIQASVQNGVDFVQVENMVNKGYIDSAQAPALMAIYGAGNMVSPVIGNYILKNVTANPALKAFVAEQATNMASVGGATYKMIKDNGGSDQQAATESAKVAGLTAAAGIGFHLAAQVPAFINKYAPTFQNRSKWIIENKIDLDGVSAIPYKPTGDAELDTKLADVPKANGNIIISNRDIVDIAKNAPVQAKNAVERIAETVKAGNLPAPVAVETKPDVPAIQEMVTKINADGMKPGGKLGKEWVAGFKDTDLSAVKEGDAPKAKDTKAKIEFAHQAQLAATQIFGEKVPIVKVFNMLNMDNLPISATIKDGFDGSIHDKIINGESVTKAEEFVAQVELKNVTDFVRTRIQNTFPDNWLEKTIGMYSIAGSKKIEDALFDFYSKDTFAGTDGKAVPSTLNNIEIDADAKIRTAATTVAQMTAVENTAPSIIAKPEALPTDNSAVPAPEVKAEEPAIVNQKGKKLSTELTGAKPRYGYGENLFKLEFESDIDKALYIVAQKKPSKSDEKYMTFLRPLFANSTDAEIRSKGEQVRSNIKSMAKNYDEEVLVIKDNNMLEDAPPPTEEELAVQAEAEVAKETKKPKAKKKPIVSDVPKSWSVEKLNTWMRGDQEAVKAQIIAENPQWLKDWKKYANNVDEKVEPVQPFNEWVEDRLAVAFAGESLIYANNVQSMAGIGLMTAGILDELYGNDDGTNEASIGGVAIIGLGALIVGGMAYSFIKGRVMQSKYKYGRTTIPNDIAMSSAAQHPESIGAPNFESVVATAKKLDKLQTAVGTTIFDAFPGVAAREFSITAGYPQYAQYEVNQGLFDLPMPSKLYRSIDVSLNKLTPVVEKVDEAYHALIKATGTKTVGSKALGAMETSGKKEMAFLSNGYVEYLRKLRDLSFRPQTYTLEDGAVLTGTEATNKLISELNSPEGQANILRNTKVDGESLTEAQIGVLMLKKPLYDAYQRALQNVTMEAESWRLLDVPYAKLPEMKKELSAAKSKLNEELDKYSEYLRAIRNDQREAKRTNNTQKIDDIQADIKVTKKMILSGRRDLLELNEGLRNIERIDDMANNPYQNVVGTVSQGKYNIAIIRTVELNSEGKYVRTSIRQTADGSEPYKGVIYDNNGVTADKKARGYLTRDGFTPMETPNTGFWENKETGEVRSYYVRNIAKEKLKYITNKQKAEQLAIKLVTKKTPIDTQDIEEITGMITTLEAEQDPMIELGETGDPEISAHIDENNKQIKRLQELVQKENIIAYGNKWLYDVIFGSMTRRPINQRTGNFRILNLDEMSAHDIYQYVIDTGTSTIDNAKSSLTSHALNGEAIKQLQSQNILGINNNYNAYLEQIINSTSVPANKFFLTGQYEMPAKWDDKKGDYKGIFKGITVDFGQVSQMLAMGTAFKLLFTFRAPVKNVVMGLAGQALAKDIIGGSLFSHGKNFFANSLSNTGRAWRGMAKYGSIEANKPRPSKVFNPIEGNPHISSHELVKRVWENQLHSDIYMIDPVHNVGAQGWIDNAIHTAFFAMKLGELNMRSATAATASGYWMRENSFENSGFSKVQDWLDEAVFRGALASDLAHGKYGNYDIAPITKLIAGNMFTRPLLLLTKPALNQTFNWYQIFRKPIIDFQLTDGGLKKTATLFTSAGRALTTVGTLTLIGGARAVIGVTEITTMLATGELFMNGGKWSATAQTKLEHYEEEAKKIALEMGMSEDAYSIFHKIIKYSIFSVLSGVNLSDNAGVYGYFTPVLPGQFEKFVKDFDKANKDGNVWQAIGKASEGFFVPTILKYSIHTAKQAIAGIKMDKDGNPIQKVVNGKTVNIPYTFADGFADMFGGQSLNEYDISDTAFNTKNPLTNEEQKITYLTDIATAPMLTYKTTLKKGALIAQMTQDKDWLAHAQDMKNGAGLIDMAYTPYIQHSQLMITEYIKNHKDEVATAAHGYGQLPSIKDEKVLPYTKQLIKWAAEYYQSKASFELVKTAAERYNLGIDAGSIKFDEPVLVDKDGNESSLSDKNENEKGYYYALDKMNKKLKGIAEPEKKGQQKSNPFFTIKKDAEGNIEYIEKEQE